MDRFIIKSPSLSSKPKLQPTTPASSSKSSAPNKDSPVAKKTSKYRAFKDAYFVTYPWLFKKEDKLFCKFCSEFPAGIHKSDAFLEGWSGNEEGFKSEMFDRHAIRHSKKGGPKEKYEHKYGQVKCNVQPSIANSINKIPAVLYSQLAAKFVATNLIATEKLSIRIQL